MVSSAVVPPTQRRRATFTTVVITTDEPGRLILSQNEYRVCAWVQPIDASIVLGSTIAEVSAPQNTVASVPSPSGAYIPVTNTSPYQVDTTDAVYAGLTTNDTNRVAVTEVTIVRT
jgi:hypothetical protein